MISTFDLTLMGSLVSLGGLIFLRLGTRPHLEESPRNGRRSADAGSTPESRNALQRSTASAGVRWLTVGVLTLLLAYARGAEEGYLFGPWGDVMFHLVFVSGCWGMTASRMKQAAERPTGRTNDKPIPPLSLPGTSPARTGD
jgi:hypothetical protein